MSTCRREHTPLNSCADTTVCNRCGQAIAWDGTEYVATSLQGKRPHVWLPKGTGETKTRQPVQNRPSPPDTLWADLFWAACLAAALVIVSALRHW